jgi:hypothetical protein
VGDDEVIDEAVVALRRALDAARGDAQSISRVTTSALLDQDWGDLAISGLVDAELPGTGGVMWAVDLVRRNSRWFAERDVTVYPRGSDPIAQKLGADQVNIFFTDVEFATLSDLMGSLSRLADELLTTPPPHAGSPDTYDYVPPP